MSLYSDYLSERTDDEIYECDNGFITWRYLNESEVYIVDLYVKPEARRSHLASHMADDVACKAKNRGCTTLLGTVVPGTKGSDTSLKVLQSYGMTLHSAKENLIIMKKDI